MLIFQHSKISLLPVIPCFSLELPGHLMFVVAIVNKGLLIRNFSLIIVTAYQKVIDLCRLSFEEKPFGTLSVILNIGLV